MKYSHCFFKQKMLLPFLPLKEKRINCKCFLKIRIYLSAKIVNFVEYSSHDNYFVSYLCLNANCPKVV